jgi:AP endonuclease 1
MVRQSPRKASARSVKVEKTVTTSKVNGRTNSAAVEVVKTAVVKVTKAKKSPVKRKAPKEEDELEEDKPTAAAADSHEAKPKKKRKTKEEKAAEAMPLAARTAIASLGKPMYIGAHVSGAGGVHNSITNAVHIGANSFALFLKSQRKWESPPLAEDAKTQFIAMGKEEGFDAAKHVLPHGSYLVNLAQLDKEKAEQGYKSFIDDLRRCEALGIRLYNFHPGSTGGETRDSALGRIAAQLNRAHNETESVVTLLENMCGSGNVIGGTWEELRDVIENVKDKSRVGVCLDTCHAFAAGHDLRSPEAFAETMATFDKVIGLKYLKALHLNDSKAPFGSHRDLHANIGTGFLGLRAFHNVMNFTPLQNLPMVLETPIDKKGPDGKTFEDKQVWADEIKLLESLIGMDAESDGFKALERTLSAKGEEERKRLQDQVDRKAAKDAKKGTKGKRKSKKAEETEESDVGSD